MFPTNLSVVFLSIPRIGKATELMAFIFPESRCHLMFNRFASVSVMKLWVAPESIIVPLSSFEVQIGTSGLPSWVFLRSALSQLLRPRILQSHICLMRLESLVVTPSFDIPTPYGSLYIGNKREVID